jgi:hypothetical protein
VIQYTIKQLATGLFYYKGIWAEEPEFFNTSVEADTQASKLKKSDLPIEICPHHFSPVELGLI